MKGHSGLSTFLKLSGENSVFTRVNKELIQAPVNVYFRSLTLPMVILNVAKLAFIMKSNLAGLPHLV